jgi:diguanylate cyclase (GGDEF)-like protein/PAS domain S-box-containing protein
MGDVAWTMDLELNTTYISPSSTRVYGFTPEERIQMTVDQIMTPESLVNVAQKLQEELAKEENGSDELNSEIIESEMYHKNGVTVWMESLVKALRDSDGKITGIYGSSRDISDRKQAEEDLRESEALNKSIVNAIPDIIFKINIHGVYLDVITSDSEKLFMPKEKMVGKTFAEILPKEPAETIIKSIEKAFKKKTLQTCEYLLDVPAGSLYFEARIVPIDKTNAYMLIRDITDRKHAEEQIRYIGYHDQLTDLYNRHYFESCEEELKDIPVLSVIMTDVNGLKLINDTYGHEAGDELIKKYAELLRRSFKESDIIFRWGGDEFIVILKNTEEAKSWELCNRLIKHCGKVFVKDIPLSISVGISSKLQGGNFDEAIKEAEDMMYKNKLTESKSSKNLIMKTLQQTLSEKSFETKEHIDRMTLIGCFR